jgi:hypothetical protein
MADKSVSNEEELNDLIKSWRTISPEFEMGKDIPVLPSTVEEEGKVNIPEPTLSNFWIKLTPEEFNYTQKLLDDVATHLNVFTSICKSKLRPDEWKLFDNKLPSACAELISGMMIDQRTKGERGVVNPSLNPESGLASCTSDDFYVSSFQNLDINDSEVEAFFNLEIHECGERYCPLRGLTWTEEQIVRQNPINSGFCCPILNSSVIPERPKTPKVLDQEEPEKSDDSTQEESTREDYNLLGARPKARRSQMWLSKKLNRKEPKN